MVTVSGSSQLPPQNRPGHPCRILRRCLDDIRSHLVQRGLCRDEDFAAENIYGILFGGRNGLMDPPDPVSGNPDYQCLSYGTSGWLCDPEKLIVTLEKGFDQVGVNLAALRNENEVLKRDLAEQVGAIGREVEPEYFQVILTILATGSIRAAASALGMRKSTLADRLQRYASRGGTHAFLYRLVKVRRRVLGSRRLVEFREEILTHNVRIFERDADGLLRELMNALEAQNERNWPMVRQELLDLLAEYAE